MQSCQEMVPWTETNNENRFQIETKINDVFRIKWTKDEEKKQQQF